MLHDFPQLENLVRDRFKERLTNFYPYLRIHVNLSIQGRLGTPEKFRETLRVIDSTCKMDSSLSYTRNLLDWIPKWLKEFPDQLIVLTDLRVFSFEWTCTIQDYLNTALADQFRSNFSHSVEFCIYFLQDPKVNPNILQAIELCFLKKSGELKVLVNSLSNQNYSQEEIIKLAKNVTQVFFQASHDNVNRAYKVLAIKSFSEICYLSLINTTQELDSLNIHVQSLILKITKEIGKSERSFRSAFIRTLQSRILFLLFLDSNGVYDELLKILTGSTDHQGLNDFLDHLMKKDERLFIDTTEQFLSILISISEHMRPNLQVIKRIVDAVPALFYPVFKSTNAGSNEKNSIFQSLFQNLMLQILRIAHKWLKEMQHYSEEFKNIVLRHLMLMKTYFSYMKSDRNQLIYLICCVIKWLLVNDDETRKASLTTSILYMGSSLLQKEDLVKLSKTLENILPSSGAAEDFTASYGSFFSKYGVSFMKEDQNSDPERIDKSKEKKIDFFPNIPITKRHWGSLDTWTEIASSSLKRKDNSSQGNRSFKKLNQIANQKGLSKLGQIKAEVRSIRVEGRRTNDIISSSKAIQKIKPDKSPIKEKRSTKILDITSLNPVSSTVNVVHAQKKPIKMHDIEQFYKQILSWNILDSASPTPPGIDKLERPKDSYNDYQSYFNSFYPLFLTELWGQLIAEWTEQKSRRAIEIITQHVSHIGDFIGSFQ